MQGRVRRGTARGRRVSRWAAAGVVALAAASTIGTASAPADAGVIPSVTATPTSLVAGATTLYTIGFTTSVPLIAGDTIMLSAPSTLFPLVASDYSVGGFPVTTLTQTTANDVTITVAMTLPSTSVTVLATLTNPTVPGNYAMSVSTSVDTTGATSSNYAITAGGIAPHRHSRWRADRQRQYRISHGVQRQPH